MPGDNYLLIENGRQNFYNTATIYIFKFSIINHIFMTYKLKSLVKLSILAALLILSASAMAQDGTIYPFKTPAEPNAIPLGIGGVNNQPAAETWFRH